MCTNSLPIHRRIGRLVTLPERLPVLLQEFVFFLPLCIVFFELIHDALKPGGPDHNLLLDYVVRIYRGIPKVRGNTTRCKSLTQLVASASLPLPPPHYRPPSRITIPLGRLGGSLLPWPDTSGSCFHPGQSSAASLLRQALSSSHWLPLLHGVSWASFQGLTKKFEQFPNLGNTY